MIGLMDRINAVWVIDERVDGVYNDLKAFIHIRIHSLQHGKNNIGGGNITEATALFSVLNFLGKIQYYLDKKERTPVDDGEPNIIEEQAFIHLVRKLDAEGVHLGLPSDKPDSLKLVWSGFRNKLAHVSGVEDGKQVMAYVINDPEGNLTIDDFLDKIKDSEPFEHNGEYRDWKLNADILLAKLPAIKQIITSQISDNDQNSID